MSVPKNRNLFFSRKTEIELENVDHSQIVRELVMSICKANVTFNQIMDNIWELQNSINDIDLSRRINDPEFLKEKKDLVNQLSYLRDQLKTSQLEKIILEKTKELQEYIKSYPEMQSFVSDLDSRYGFRIS